MKKTITLIILLTVALIGISIRLAYALNDNKTKDQSGSQEIINPNAPIQCIMTRTSVRDYTDRPIAKETLDTILKAGMAAPTAMNKQPWQFVVVDDAKLRSQMADALEYGDNIRKCNLAIVMCGDMSLAADGQNRDYWIQDLSAATENVLLAAQAVGVGAVWCGIYPIQQRVDAIRELLNLPSDWIPLDIVALGYPSAPTTPKEKWNPQKVHYNRQ